MKDFPGNQELKESNAGDAQQIRNCGSLIYVIDAQQQEYETPCIKLRDIIKSAQQINPNISYEVFIHKVDTDMFLSDEQKMDTLTDIQEIMRNYLNDLNL